MRASWSRRGGGLGLEAGLAPRPAGSGGGGGSARGSHGPGSLRAPRPAPAPSAGGAGRRRGPLTSSVTRGCSFPRTWLQGTRCRWGSWPSSSRGRLCGSASPALARNCSPTFAIFAARGPRRPLRSGSAPAGPRRRPSPALPGPASPAAPGRSRDVQGPPGARGGARGGGLAGARSGPQGPGPKLRAGPKLQAPSSAGLRPSRPQARAGPQVGPALKAGSTAADGAQAKGLACSPQEPGTWALTSSRT